MLIEQFSHQLNDNKISVGRFLSIMSNMDNKIAYEEHEFPELDTDEIPFENVNDIERFKAMMSPSTNIDDDTSPIVLKTNLPPAETIAAKKRKRTNKIASKATEKRTVLTRSKARKLASQTKDAQNDQQANNEEPVSINATSADLISPQTKDVQNVRQANICESDSTNSIEIPLDATLSSQTCATSIENLSSEIDDDDQLRPHVNRNQGINFNTPNSDLDAVTELTSSAVEIFRLHNKFDEIINGSNVPSKSTFCVMQCNREKGTLLLPCKHQPTCKQCFVLWKVFCLSKKLKTFCPICKNDVKNTIIINDE